MPDESEASDGAIQDFWALSPEEIEDLAAAYPQSDEQKDPGAGQREKEQDDE